MIKFTFAIILIAFNNFAFAGYARPKPPGWSPTSAGGLPGFKRPTPANDPIYRNPATGGLLIPVATELAGGKVPWTLPTAANAARFAASRSFLPMALGQMAVDALKSWLAGGADLVFDPLTGLWRWVDRTNPNGNLDGFSYSPDQSHWFDNKSDACSSPYLIPLALGSSGRRFQSATAAAGDAWVIPPLLAPLLGRGLVK